MNARTHIKSLIAEFLRAPPTSIDEQAPLTQFITDSFALVELAVHLQEETDVLLEREDFEGISRVGDLIDLFDPAVGTTRKTGARS